MRRKPLFPPPVSATTGQRLRHKGRQPITALTVNGRIRIRRVRWHEPGVGAATPLDERLDAAQRTFSRGVQEMLCRLNQASPSFVQTAQLLERLASLSISGETARQLIEEEGRRAASAVRRGRLDFGWTADDCRTAEGTTRVYLGCDGVKVPLVTDAEKRKRRAGVKEKRRRCGRKRGALPALKPGADQAFKEFRVVTAYDESQRRRAVAVTAGDCAATGRLLRATALRLKIAEADESIANVDGAPWIRGQLELHRPVQWIGLDYYHLQDYVQKTRREVYGEGSAEGGAWVDQLMTLFLEQGADAALERIVAWRKDLRGRKRQAADRLLGYVAERRGMIHYREFRAAGWQIGSGPVEAQCKTTTLRLKGRGRRWDRDHAEGIMALAAIQASRLWNQWWATPDAPAA
jgi:hypothetical protein